MKYIIKKCKYLYVILCLHSLLGCNYEGIILKEDFSKQPVNTGWKLDLSEGNTGIVSPEGIFRIEAFRNSYAHIQRPVDESNMRIEVMLKPDFASSWGNGITIYWNQDNWVRISITAADQGGVGVWMGGTGGGYIKSDMMLNGNLSETLLSSCYANRWHKLGLELGEDCMRFPVSQDGTMWVNTKVIDRPKEWMGKKPELLIIGKGYTDKHHQQAEFNNDYQDKGPKEISLYKSIVISKIDKKVLQLSSEEKQMITNPDFDWLGKEEITSLTGPTFESVSSHLPAMLFSRELVGIKNHPQYIGVGFDGALELNSQVTMDYHKTGIPAGVWEVGQEPKRLGWEVGSCQKSLVEGWKPIIHCRYTESPVEPSNGYDPTLEFDQTIFGYAKNFSHEEELYAYSKFTITNKSDESKKVPVQFRLYPTDQKKTWNISLSPHESTHLFLKVPYSSKFEQIEQIQENEFVIRMKEVSEYWDDQYSGTMRLSSPEARVNHTFLAWDMWNLLNIRRNHEDYNVYDGAGFYEEWFGYSASDHIFAHDLMGHHEDVRNYLATCLRKVNKEGEWKTAFGLPDTPALLRILAFHYQLTGDTDWLREVSPAMIRMCYWIIHLRKNSLPTNQADLVKGLLFYRPYADYGAPTYSYLSDAMLCVGLEKTAEVLKDIGLTEEADYIGTHAEAYRKDIVRSMKASIHEHEGQKYMPMFPESRALLKESNYKADNYYGLVAGMLLASGFLDTEPELSSLLIETIEQRNGLLLGCMVFRGGIDHAYLYGYLEQVLKCNEPEKAVLGLYGWMSYGNTRNTYCGVEMTNQFTGDNQSSLPHGYSHAVQTMLLRNMLLREEGNTLYLAQATPRQWNKKNSEIKVSNAPSFFGKTGYYTKMDDTGKKMTVKIDYPKRKTDCQIVFFARHPEQKKIQSVSFDGEEYKNYDQNMIILGKDHRPETITVTF